MSADTAPDRPRIQVLKGEPTDDELAALVAVLAGAAGSPAEPGTPQRNQWGDPVDKLRYSIYSWQQVTLLERTHVRR